MTNIQTFYGSPSDYCVTIFGSPTKFLVVLRLPDYHYFDPCLPSGSRVYLLVAVYEDDPECGGNEAAATVDVDVVALTDVVDVDGDAGVRADAVLLHQRDQLTLRQEVRGTRLSLTQLRLQQQQSGSVSTTVWVSVSNSLGQCRQQSESVSATV